MDKSLNSLEDHWGYVSTVMFYSWYTDHSCLGNISMSYIFTLPNISGISHQKPWFFFQPMSFAVSYHGSCSISYTFRILSVFKHDKQKSSQKQQPYWEKIPRMKDFPASHVWFPEGTPSLEMWQVCLQYLGPADQPALRQLLQDSGRNPGDLVFPRSSLS